MFGHEAMKPVVAFLRERGIRLIIHTPRRPTDPLQLPGYPTQSDGIHQGLFQALGLIINKKKSQLESSQEIVLFGLAVLTTTMQVTLPREKMV